MRAELSSAMQDFFDSLTLPDTPLALTNAEQDWLIDLASLVVRARSAVERDGRTHEIELIPDPEAPTRLVLTLARLYAGLRAVQVTKAEAWQLINKIGFDSLPALRWRVLHKLLQIDTRIEGHVEAPTLAAALGYPTQTTRRTLEDLAAHGLITRKKGKHADRWCVPTEVIMLYKSVIGKA
jgi:DNA-binding MarR family transcriptional regulator